MMNSKSRAAKILELSKLKRSSILEHSNGESIAHKVEYTKSQTKKEKITKTPRKKDESTISPRQKVRRWLFQNQSVTVQPSVNESFVCQPVNSGAVYTETENQISLDETINQTTAIVTLNDHSYSKTVTLQQQTHYTASKMMEETTSQSTVIQTVTDHDLDYETQMTLQETDFFAAEPGCQTFVEETIFQSRAIQNIVDPDYDYETPVTYHWTECVAIEPNHQSSVEETIFQSTAIQNFAIAVLLICNILCTLLISSDILLPL